MLAAKQSKSSTEKGTYFIEINNELYYSVHLRTESDGKDSTESVQGKINFNCIICVL